MPRPPKPDNTKDTFYIKYNNSLIPSNKFYEYINNKKNTGPKILQNCKAKVKIVEVCSSNIIDDLIDYYKGEDSNGMIYLNLRKEEISGKTKYLEKVMENGGDLNMIKILDRLFDKEEEIDFNIEVDNDIIFLMDDDYGDVEYNYNEELEMYTDVDSKVFVNPGNYGAKKLFFYTYVKIISTY